MMLDDSEDGRVPYSSTRSSSSLVCSDCFVFTALGSVLNGHMLAQDEQDVQPYAHLSKTDES